MSLPFKVYGVKNASRKEANIYFGRAKIKGVNGDSENFYEHQTSELCDSTFLFASIVGSRNIRVTPATVDDPFVYLDSRKYFFLPYRMDIEDLSNEITYLPRTPNVNEKKDFIVKTEQEITAGFITEGVLLTGKYLVNDEYVSISGYISSANITDGMVQSGRLIGNNLISAKIYNATLTNAVIIKNDGVELSDVEILEAKLTNTTIRNTDSITVSEIISQNQEERFVKNDGSRITFHDSSVLDYVEYRVSADQIVKFKTIDSDGSVLIKTGCLPIAWNGNGYIYDEAHVYRKIKQNGVQLTNTKTSPNNRISISDKIIPLNTKDNAYQDGWVYLESSPTITNSNSRKSYTVTLYSANNNDKEDLVVEFYGENQNWTTPSNIDDSFEENRYTTLSIPETNVAQKFRIKSKSNSEISLFAGIENDECDNTVKIYTKNYLFIPNFALYDEEEKQLARQSTVSNIMRGTRGNAINTFGTIFKNLVGDKCIKVKGPNGNPKDGAINDPNNPNDPQNPDDENLPPIDDPVYDEQQITEQPLGFNPSIDKLNQIMKIRDITEARGAVKWTTVMQDGETYLQPVDANGNPVGDKINEDDLDDAHNKEVLGVGDGVGADAGQDKNKVKNEPATITIDFDDDACWCGKGGSEGKDGCAGDLKIEGDGGQEDDGLVINYTPPDPNDTEGIA